MPSRQARWYLANLAMYCTLPPLHPPPPPHEIHDNNPNHPSSPSTAIANLGSESKLVQAVGKYTAAIELRPTAIYLSNRAFCYVKLEQFGLAILDADLALT